MKTTPSFWYPDHGSLSVMALLLWPLTWLWRWAAWLREKTASPYHPKTPTIVIGNITVGGTGKTPFVAALAEAAIATGRRPVILTRGYGGRVEGPHLVTDQDNADDVGDEACWLSRYAPVIVSRHRGKGAAWIDAHRPECDLIIMDDGLQNPSVIPHRRIAVFNGRLGIGNGHIIPAGPLREPWDALNHYDAVVLTGDDNTGIRARIKALSITPSVFKADRHFKEDEITSIKGKAVFAFAGIGDPQSFYAMLKAEGVHLTGTRSFPDHHPYNDDEIAFLKKQAYHHHAMLVTTEKDMMRLTPDQAKGIHALGLKTHIERSFMDILPTPTV